MFDCNQEGRVGFCSVRSPDALQGRPAVAEAVRSRLVKNRITHNKKVNADRQKKKKKNEP